ncbi:MAG: hypothetical protein ACOC1K_05435 [Nanoarchaeota archaeon]
MKPAETEKEKKKYFKKYLKNKKKCRKWYAADKKYREIVLWSYGKDNIGGDIWEDIMDEQLYEPELDTRLKRKIW